MSREHFVWEVSARDCRNKHFVTQRSGHSTPWVRCQEDTVSEACPFAHLHTPRGCEMSGPLTTDFPPGVSRKCLCSLRRTDTLWSQPLSLPLSLPQLPSPSEKALGSAAMWLSSWRLPMPSSAGVTAPLYEPVKFHSQEECFQLRPQRWVWDFIWNKDVSDWYEIWFSS